MKDLRPTLNTDVSRRSFLKGLAGILAAGFAPAAIGSGVLMPIKKLWTPPAAMEAIGFDMGRIDQSAAYKVWYDGSNFRVVAISYADFYKDAAIIDRAQESK